MNPLPHDIDSVNHVGVIAHSLDQAVSCYEAMGFILSPLSMHAGNSKPGEPVVPMATGNRCAVFPDNYVELVGILIEGAPDWGCSKLLDRFQGSHILCLGSTDVHAMHRRISAHRLPTTGVIALQRDVPTPAGPRTARFECLHLEHGSTAEGLVQAAHHLTPELIHQPHLLEHPNGAKSLSEVVFSVSDLEPFITRYEQFTGYEAQRDGKGWRIDLPRASSLIFLRPEDVAERLPGSLMTTPPSIAALGFEVADLGRVDRILRKSGLRVTRHNDTLIVSAEQALGTIHYFHAR